MRIAILDWRDLTHPEGGGAERYAQTVAAGLAARGHEVTYFCSAHGGAPADEFVDGYRIMRQGSRLSVYAASLRTLRRFERTHGRFDVVVDTQNGLPFWAPLATRSPVVCLVHHVHRENWPVVLGPVAARVGWFIESQVAPRVYRGRQYVAVSGRTRDELAGLGVDPGAVAVIHNGTDEVVGPRADRAPMPTLVVLGRLVPHKRVELAIEVLARLHAERPGLRLRVVGGGWWHTHVSERAAELGVTHLVDLLGHVDEATKHHELARAWVALAPSAKEGWGLNVVEAASHRVPTVAHHGAGGLSESIVDGVTGVLVEDLDGLTAATARLLDDAELRTRLGAAAAAYAERFTWAATVDHWEALLAEVAAGAPVRGDVDRDAGHWPAQAVAGSDTGADDILDEWPEQLVS